MTAFREIASFEVFHGTLEWPWVAFAADRGAVAYLTSKSAVATLVLDGERVVAGPSFGVPPDLDLTSFALGPQLLAAAGRTGDGAAIVLLDPSGERTRAKIDDVLGPGHEVRAMAFDRTGRHLWLSTETATETVIALVDVATLARVDAVPSAPFPRPANHELHLHAQDDAVLLLAACGQDGTFARVVGFTGAVVSAIPTEIDPGAAPAGFVGFSADGARVHLAADYELRTHAWPTLHELSSVDLPDELESSYSGAVLGTDVFVDCVDVDAGEDAVMLFDQTAIAGIVLPLPVPQGMWAGRLGREMIVTIEAKGDPARARVYLRSAVAKGNPNLS